MRFWILTNFNPPTPCGVGLIPGLEAMFTPLFQSTHPVWGGTLPGPWGSVEDNISIHPPRVGWDFAIRKLLSHIYNFNPPTPCGVGQQKFTKQAVELLRK